MPAISYLHRHGSFYRSGVHPAEASAAMALIRRYFQVYARQLLNLHVVMRMAAQPMAARPASNFLGVLMTL